MTFLLFDVTAYLKEKLFNEALQEWSARATGFVKGGQNFGVIRTE
jgi:hypothetical protein